ncbi:hypothetical protein [Granulicella arctica]|uniref:Membrane-associated oxidoreductase n=1 Tax=Granulicella arctica TaxID=940613 RepID=A0A7Y9TJW2_9BACT|nr:hypothetical protein [Granulicella arctica]NYF78687.1 hypothetical protein [Granulicella arctica]
MPLADQLRGNKLLALAQERFDSTLRPIEEQILRHSCTYDDPPRTGTRPDPTWLGPELRPRFLRWLATDPDALALIEHRGIRIWNARLTEPLDLQSCHIPARIEFRYCLFSEPVHLASAEIRSLYLLESTLLKDIDGSRIALHGPLYIRNVVAAGKLAFDSAQIDGQLVLSNTTLTATGIEHTFGNAVIRDHLLFTPAFQSAGSLHLISIHIGGTFCMDGAVITATTGSIALDQARIQGEALLRRLQSSIELRLASAEIGGAVNCSGAQLTATESALTMDGATIHGELLLNDGFQSAGVVRMPDARIDGQLNCDSAKLTTTGVALILDGVKVRSHTFLSEGFQSAGSIRMLGAQIGGQLNFDSARITATGDALTLVRITIDADLFFNNGFECAGTIRLLGANIGGQLNCEGAKLTATGDAMRLDAATIRGGVYLNKGFASTGVIGMPGAKITGQLVCAEASIKSLWAENMELDGDLFWVELQNPREGSLSLAGAKIKRLFDDTASWPAPENLIVNGLEVDELHGTDPLRAKTRIPWLNLQSAKQRIEPQPWMELAKLLNDKGYQRDAKRVLFELRRHQARARWKNPLALCIAILFRRLEEQPLRILLPILFCVALGTAIFMPLRAHFAPTSDAAYKTTYTSNAKSAAKSSELPIAYPQFQPVVYALENVLPIVRLGQDDHWAPDAHLGSRRIYWSLMSMRWFLILAGWAQGVVLAAAVSGRFRT